MCNELVRLSTQDVGKGIPITDSFIISKKFKVTNLSVVKLVKKYKSDFLEFGKLNAFQMTRDNKQRSFEVFVFNEAQFYLLVTYMKNTEVARFYKKEFVKAFMNAKNELVVRIETRKFGKFLRKSLTDAIKNCITDEGNFKKFAYSNYSRLVYRKVLGKKVKTIKEERGLKATDNIRNFLSNNELEQVQELESKIATFIEFTDNADKTDKEIYSDVKKYIENK